MAQRRAPSFVAWRRSVAPVPYETALQEMERRVEAIRRGQAPELVWLLEHPPVYTAGTSARPEELLDPRFPVYRVGRGGRYTYHGPGQRVGYVMLDLARRGRDLRAFVRRLECWLIRSLADFGIAAERREGRIGIWTRLADGREAKIGALGVRVRRWVTFHGVALNVAPELTHFSGIVPCGLREFPVTSMAALGVRAGMEEVDRALRVRFEEVFQVATRDEPAPGGACAAKPELAPAPEGAKLRS